MGRQYLEALMIAQVHVTTLLRCHENFLMSQLVYNYRVDTLSACAAGSCWWQHARNRCPLRTAGGSFSDASL
jgi:hypothetical protein